MNYHEKAMEVIEIAQANRKLFTLLMRAARKNPKVIVETGLKLGLIEKKEPVVPPALIRGAGKRNKYKCNECGEMVNAIGLGGDCIDCNPFFKNSELNTEVIAHG
jgi:hypothetical protein